MLRLRMARLPLLRCTAGVPRASGRLSTRTGGGDHYTVLNISNRATSQEIKKAYFKEAKKWHPDINPGHENKFRQLAEAYDVWSELGFAEIDAYVSQIRSEMQSAGSSAAKGEFGPAWAFAKEHKALVLGTVIPITLFFRSPVFAATALRILGPLFAISLRVSPQMTWYLFSRLWIAAIKYVERTVKTVTK